MGFSVVEKLPKALKTSDADAVLDELLAAVGTLVVVHRLAPTVAIEALLQLGAGLAVTSDISEEDLTKQLQALYRDEKSDFEKDGKVG